MSDPLLQIDGVSKAFFGTSVLKQVSLSLAAGRVLGLVGENGAGKSTLMNILAGVLPADAGTIRLGGTPYAPRSPAEAARAGVALVHQELNLFTNLSIAENIFLAELPRRAAGLWINRRRLYEETRRLLESVDLPLDPRQRVENLSPGERQLIEIVRGLHAQARLIIFDEPTTSLTQPEAERLFTIIDRLRAQGIAVIYISHTLGDVLRLSDEIVVLRDGALVASGPKPEFTLPRLVSLMVGRELEQVFPSRSAAPAAEPLLEVRSLTQPGVVEDISFTLHRGEVLGLAGLMGSGRTELARILFGLDPYRRGEILLQGKPLRPSPRECMRRCMAFLTENRRDEGLLPEASIAENVALASLPRFTRRRPVRLLDWAALRRTARESATALAVNARAPERQLAKTLSGGNQQKVVLAKWLLREPIVFLLDEPTRGVDVGAKFEIYRTINDLVVRGSGVLLISSEIEELIGLCDRILVMSRGTIGACYSRDEFHQERILRAALGSGRLEVSPG